MQKALFLRYGGDTERKEIKMNLTEIALKLRIPNSSLYFAFRRYEANGFQWFRKKYSGPNNPWDRVTKIKGEIKSTLLSHKCLQEWSGFTIRQRCKLVKERWDLNVGARAL